MGVYNVKAYKFCGNVQRTNHQNKNIPLEKKCEYIGAASGLTLAAVDVISSREAIKFGINEAVEFFASRTDEFAKMGIETIDKNVLRHITKTIVGASCVVGAGFLIGAGAFAGKMIGKAINHFKKPTETKEVQSSSLSLPPSFPKIFS